MPLVFVSDFIVGNFSQYFTIALGICFVVIVFYLPGGVARDSSVRGSGSGRADRGVTVDGAGDPLRVRALRKAFGGLIAVRDISFDVPAGGITGLIGPNGSGKTTVLNLITGELPPDAGSIHFNGREIIGIAPFEVCRARDRTDVSARPRPPRHDARENVMLGRMFGSDPNAPRWRSAKPTRCSSGSVFPTGRISSVRSSPISTRNG